MLLTVAAYTDPLLAHLLRGRLEAEGVAAWIADEHTALNDWTLRQALGGVKVRVLAEQFVEARAVVHQFDAGGFLLAEEVGAPPCYESTSSRLAYLALFWLSPPMPWRRSARDR